MVEPVIPPHAFLALVGRDAWVYVRVERRGRTVTRADWYVYRQRDHRPPEGAVLVGLPIWEVPEEWARLAPEEQAFYRSRADEEPGAAGGSA